MRKIAIFAPKGGTGKTTTTHSLAAELGSRGDRVLAMDCDAQGNLSMWLGADPVRRTLADVISEDVPLTGVIQPANIEHIDLIGGGAGLARAEKILLAELAPAAWLKRALRVLPANRWDWLLIDCPPGTNNLLAGTLAAVDYCLAPVPPRGLDSAGVGQMMGIIRTAEEDLNEELAFLGFLPTMVDLRRRLDRDVLAELRRKLNGKIFKTVIPQNIRAAEAPTHRKSIRELDSRCSSAQAYAAALEEVLRRVEERTW